MTQIRIAVCEDAESILKIYSPFVVNSDVTFECVVPSVEEKQTRIKTTLKVPRPRLFTPGFFVIIIRRLMSIIFRFFRGWYSKAQKKTKYLATPTHTLMEKELDITGLLKYPCMLLKVTDVRKLV